MDKVKIPIEQLVIESCSCNGHDRFSHPGFRRKLSKGIMLTDFDESEKLFELEYPSGDRAWFSLKTFFGKLLAETKCIVILYPDGHEEGISMVFVKMEKIKRTNYLLLIFERDLAF